MKRVPHVLVVALIAFSCLTFPQETKSEPFTAILLGGLWTYAVPGGLAAATGYVAWLKAKEYVYNKQAKENREALRELDEKVDQGLQDAAEGRKQIDTRLNAQGKQLARLEEGVASVQKGQEEMCADLTAQFGTGLSDLQDELKSEYSALQGEVVSFRELIEAFREEREKQDGEVRLQLNSLGLQFSIIQGQLAEDRQKFGGHRQKTSEQLRAVQEQQKEQTAQLQEQTAQLQSMAASLLKIQQQGAVVWPPQQFQLGCGGSAFSNRVFPAITGGVDLETLH